MSNCVIPNVTVYNILESGVNEVKFNEPVNIRLEYHPQGVGILFFNITNGEKLPYECVLEKSCPPIRIGSKSFILSTESSGNLFIKIPQESDATNLHIQLIKSLKGHEKSVFTERTEDSSALQYFQFYGYLSQQQNMMQDYIRTATYQKAILANLRDFNDKVVLDVGAGSGILSFFAAQAGARKVYAVEASSMAMHAETLANANGLTGKLIVLPGKIEEIELKESVDAIISEPMGYMLFNERMLETFLHAKKWLKPNGKMFPSKGDLHIAPFTDDALFLEQCNKANFWQQNCFHGVDLGCLRNAALKEYFRQPIVDTFDVRICLAKSVKYTVDFQTASEFDLHRIDIPLEFAIIETGTIHGLAFWFDVSFEGSQSTIWLSTSPTEPLTHWYQVRCLIETPILAKQGQVMKGRALLIANKRQSYDVQIDLELDGLRATNTLDLKNPYFRYTGQQPQPPPGQHTMSPSDHIWTTTLDANAANAFATNTLQTQMQPRMNGVNGVETMGLDMANMANAFGHHPGVIGANNLHYAAVPLPLADFQSPAASFQLTPAPIVAASSTQSHPANIILTNNNQHWTH